MESERQYQPLTQNEMSLTAIMLLSAGLPASTIAAHIQRGGFKKYLSGEVPSTVVALGKLEFAFPPDPDDWILAQMRFVQCEKYVEWWLLRDGDGICEIEILVTGNSEPWQDMPLPERFEIGAKRMTIPLNHDSGNK